MSARADLDDHGDGRKSLRFGCPACECSHVVPVGPGGWKWNGDLDLPTLHPSVKCLCPGGPVEVCHSFVRAGRIAYCGDSTHALAGQTVDLPAIEGW